LPDAVTLHVLSDVGVSPEFDREAVTRALRLAFADPARPIPFGLQPEIELSLTFTDDAHIRELNRVYRDLDEPTDVLSFSQLEGGEAFVQAPSGVLTLGDIVISVETAERQATAQAHSLADEVAHLAVHGALHLLGYDHQTDAQEAHMNAVAAEALKGGA
jgi:probable rRNA maturation factor